MGDVHKEESANSTKKKYQPGKKKFKKTGAYDKKPPAQTNTKSAESAPTANCKFCGKHHEFKKEKCPAYGKVCTTCGKKNHFSRCCRVQKSKSAEIDQV